jgi:glycosyltransferase involved in cell wall biosynthesis
VQDRVHFLGYRTDVARLMRACDLLVFVSRYDPCPLVVIEALASGLPVITATTTGASEFVTPDTGQVLADPNDVTAVAQAIDRLLSNAPLRRRIGLAARAAVEQHSWTRMAEDYVALFKEHVS